MKKTIGALCVMLITGNASASNTLMLIHESVINGFFDSIGEVCIDKTVVDICFKDQKITIGSVSSSFTATAIAKNFFTTARYSVTGKIDVKPDLDNSKVKIKIYNAVIQDCMFGSSCNLSDWYDPSFDLPVELPKSTHVLGKTVGIKQSNVQAFLHDSQIKIYSDLAFYAAQ